jgi:PHD/YefM family antitoxin component YafN of YafNO toxin-antitoxin module
MKAIVSAGEARQNLGELLNQAFYQDTSFIVTRDKRPMAAVIGANLFAEILKVIEKNDPGLADTLAIMTNPEVQAVLDESEEDIKAGRTVPLEQVLEDTP